MNAVLKSFGVLLMVATLTACGKTDSQKAQEKVDDANTKISRLNAISVLMKAHEMPLATYAKPSSVPLSLTAEEADRARELLKEYIRLGNEVIQASKDKDVIWSDQAKVEMQMENAAVYLTLLKDYTDVVPTATVLLRVKERNNKAAEVSDKLFNTYLVKLSSGPDEVTFPSTKSTNRTFIGIMTVDNLKAVAREAELVIKIETDAISELDTLVGRADVNANALSSARQGLVELREKAKANLELVEKTIEKRTSVVEPIAVGQ